MAKLMEQNSSSLGPELTITIAFGPPKRRLDDSNKTLLSRMLNIEDAGMKFQELNGPEKASVDTLHGHLSREETSPSDGDGEQSSKDGTQQDESNNSGIAASSNESTKQNRKKDVGHTPFRRFKKANQRYRTHVKLYNPARVESTAPSSPEAHASDARFEKPNIVIHKPTIVSKRGTFLVQQYPRVPPKSSSSVGSSELERQSDNPVNLPLPAEVFKESAKRGTVLMSPALLDGRSGIYSKALMGQNVIKQNPVKSDDRAEQSPSDRIHASHSAIAFKADAPPFIPRISFTHFSAKKEKPQPPSLEIPDLQQMLDDLSIRGANFIASNGLANDRSSAADDGASVCTRNEIWSISSFHSKTHVLDDLNENVDDSIPPPLPDSYPDFELPIDSLLKPMKKSTYNPIFQEDVQKFLDAAAWDVAGTAEQPKKGLWAEKKVPLRPVQGGVGAVSMQAAKSQKDHFLQSVGTLGADVQFRQKGFFTKYMDSYTYTLSEDFIATVDHVKKINAQTINPPDWYVKRLGQRPAVGARKVAVPKPAKPRAQRTVMSPPPPPIPRKECKVCFDKVVLEDFPKSDHLSKHNICMPCFQKYLWGKIMKEGTININCPGELCPQPLEYNEIKEYAPDKAFSRYDELLCRKAYEEDPNFRWCTNRTCSTGQIIDDGEFSSHFTCSTCNFKSCFHCRAPAHLSINCTENLNTYRAHQFAADPQSGSWLRSYTKPCFCGRWIQKMDGCDHVKCPPRPMGCGEEWCWMCGAKYDDIRKVGNTAHKGDCPHYM